MLIVRGQYVWTGQSLLHDAAVLCAEGEIIEVGQWDRLRDAHPDASVAGGPDKIVLPGIINAHHHGNGISSFLAGVADDALEPWLAALSTAPSGDPYLDTLWAAIHLLQGGYTTVVIFQSTTDPDHTQDDAAARIQACLDAGIRVALGVSLTQQNFYVYGPDPQGLPRRKGMTATEYINTLTQLRKTFADEPRARVFAAPSGPQWVTDETWQTIGQWTNEHQIPLHAHFLESPYEAEYAKRTYGDSIALHFDRLGVLHEHTSLVHGVYLNETDLDVMQSRQTSLITNPGSNLRLRCGVSPVLRAIDRGINVALGTDGCALGERDDAFAEMRLLHYLQRGPGMNTPSLSHEQALHAATRAAADVTPWRGQIGQIQSGYLADFSVYDLGKISTPWHLPSINPLQMMVQRAFADHLDQIVVGGEIVWEAPEGAVKVDSQAVADEIRQEMERSMRDDAKGRQESPSEFDIQRDHLVTQVREFFKDWPDHAL